MVPYVSLFCGNQFIDQQFILQIMTQPQAKTFKIEKNIPLPTARQVGVGPERKYKYPFREMKVGDSFVVNTTNKTFSANIYSLTKTLGMKFATRTIAIGKVRVWRVK